jgi:hypothetical protein
MLVTSTIHWLWTWQKRTKTYIKYLHFVGRVCVCVCVQWFHLCFCSASVLFLPFLGYVFPIALQYRTITEDLRIAVSPLKLIVLSILSPFHGQLWLHVEFQSPLVKYVGDFRRTLVDTSVFEVAERRGSPPRLSSSRNSQCGRWRIEPSHHCEIAGYQGALLAVQTLALLQLQHQDMTANRGLQTAQA